MRKNRIISACLILSLLLMPGCGSEADAYADEVVVLKDPQSSDKGFLTETVIPRNLYVAEIYEGAVYPEITEYAFEGRQSFGAYGALLGENVEAGQVLIKADLESLESRIESMEERLASLTETFEKTKVTLMEEISELEWNVGYYEKIFENMENQKPEEYITDAQGKKVENPAYLNWEQEMRKWTGEDNKNTLSLNQANEELRQKREVYELDYSYYNTQLKELKAQIGAAQILAEDSGEVVAMGFYSPGDSISAEKSVMAVANMDKLVIKCEYIPRRNLIYYADEYYAFINGIRYELVYDDNGESGCTTFYFADENADVKVGDYVKVILETNSREQVIAVQKDAVYVDTGGHYVYVVKDGETINTPVKIGISDGLYTEIVKGLEFGDEVLVTDMPEAASTYVLAKTDFEKTFTKNANLQYTQEEYLTNPIENGTVYLEELLVKNYQFVKEGDPIARVRVEGDMVALARQENDLKRERERLADYIAQYGDNENYAENITRQQEALLEAEEELAQVKADYATTEIYAESTGVVLWTTEVGNNSKISNGAQLVLVADVNQGYLAFETMENLNYGAMLTISYTNAAKESTVSEAKLVTMGSYGLSTDLRSAEMVHAKLSDEVLTELCEILEKQNSQTNGRYTQLRIKVSGTRETMKNVVSVPKAAVKEKDGVTYVNVLMEDGTVVPTAFLSGGSDSKNYWVIEGLTEGMTICWE